MKNLFSLGNLKTLGIVAGIVSVIWFYKSWQNRGDEIIRLEANYKNRLAEEKSHFSEYKLKKETELEQYLASTTNQLKGLQDQLDKTNIKLHQITRIVSTNVNVRDTIISVIDVDSLAQKIVLNKDFEVPILDVTDCFKFRAKFVFKDGKSSFEVLERQYNDTINYVSYWERKQWKFLFIRSRLFGKKIAKVEIFNACNNTKVKTIVIDN